VAGPLVSSPSQILIIEQRLASEFRRHHAVLTSNGSAALVIAMQAVGIGPGSRVLVPAHTWVGCATAILRVGARPVFVDARPDTPLMELEALPDEVGDAADALLAVHLFASQLEIEKWRQRFPHLRVIEDCAHCHTATDEQGRMLGTFAEISACSFQQTKILTCGEGGAAFTDDDELAASLAALRADSRVCARRAQPLGTVPLEPHGTVHGANLAMSELDAAVLGDQLDRLAEQRARRAQGAAHFVREMADKGDDGVPVFSPASLASGAFYGLVVRFPRVPDSDAGSAALDAVIESVRQRTSITLNRSYPPVPRSPLYRPQSIPLYALHAEESREYPEALRWFRTSLVVPHDVFLGSSEVLTRLADSLIEAAGNRPPTFGVAPARPVETSSPAVTVVIVSRRDRAFLEPALESIDAQDFAGSITRLVIRDLPPIDPAPSWSSSRHRTEYVYIHEVADRAERPLVSRVARLRNCALEYVETPLVCFLDDDNRWERDHLSSLVGALCEADVAAAHSWRQLVDSTGRPWRPTAFPWLPPGPQERARFDSCRAAEIFDAGSSIVRDRVSSIVNGTEVGMVDLGEWLFRTELLRTVRFPVDYDSEDAANRVGEDDRLLESFRRLGVPVICTNRATLIYRLGGMSNEFDPARC
jgi:dTDP-4-amino-4,6-dideoxygalactose transaminase